MDKNKLMMIIIIVLLLVMVGSIVAGTLFIVNSMGAPTIEADGQMPTQTPPPPPPTQGEIRVFTMTDDIITNLLQAPGGRPHIVRLLMGIGIDNTDEEAADEFFRLLADQEIVVQDLVTGILRRTTIDEITRIDGTDVLRDEILMAMQSRFGNNLIVEVYISVYHY